MSRKKINTQLPVEGGVQKNKITRLRFAMCRNIKRLYNFEPPATPEEIQAASLQFIRKVSGFSKPSQANQAAFQLAVDDVSMVVQTLLNTLVTHTAPLDRETVAQKNRERAAKRFG
jgi:hypothetical protein